MGLEESISRQFGNPRGALGRVAGFIMSHRASNIERIAWAVSLLDLRPQDCVLEIGFGPGVGIRMLSDRATEGAVYGVDHSPLMARAAFRRNRGAVEAGLVDLRVASAARLPTFDRSLDKVLDVNTFQFWDDPIAVLVELKRLMNPGGVVAIAHQPRSADAVRQDAIDAGARIAESLATAGFCEVKIEMREMKPVPTVCVLGRNPA